MEDTLSVQVAQQVVRLFQLRHCLRELVTKTLLYLGHLLGGVQKELFQLGRLLQPLSRSVPQLSTERRKNEATEVTSRVKEPVEIRLSMFACELHILRHQTAREGVRVELGEPKPFA